MRLVTGDITAFGKTTDNNETCGNYGYCGNASRAASEPHRLLCGLRIHRSAVALSGPTDGGEAGITALWWCCRGVDSLLDVLPGRVAPGISVRGLLYSPVQSTCPRLDTRYFDSRGWD